MAERITCAALQLKKPQGLGTRLCTLPPTITILSSKKFSTQLTFELERIWSPQSKFAHMSNSVCVFYWLKRSGVSIAGQQQSIRQLHAEQVHWAREAQNLRQLCAGYKMQLLHNRLSGRGERKSFNKQKHQTQLQRYL